MYPLVSFIIIAASYGFHYHLVENSLEESLKLECSGEQFMVCEEMSNVGICDTWMLWNCYVSVKYLSVNDWLALRRE